MTDTPYKYCSAGDECVHPEGPYLPATRDYFSPGDDRYGLRPKCKACAIEYSRQYREKNAEKVKAASLKYYYEHQEEQQQRHRDWKRNNPDKVKEGKRRYREENADKVKASEKRYREENRPARLKRLKSWRERNQDRRSHYQKRYYEDGRGRASTHRRLARKRSLPNTLTTEQWTRCLEYWHGVCAYCGAQQDFWHPIEVDHYLPLSDPECPGTIASNIVPACKSCNTSKHDTPPAAWLERKFGKRQASTIQQRIGEYFEWLEAV